MLFLVSDVRRMRVPRVLVESLHAGGEIDVLAEGGVIEAGVAAEVANIGFASVEAQAREEMLAVGAELVLLTKARAATAAGRRDRIGARGRSKRKNGVADVFDNGAFGGKDAVLHGALEVGVHELREVIGVHAFRNGGEAGDAVEEDCQ